MDYKLSSNYSPVIFGEVLFDDFGNNVRVLGGAPFNVAWNLKGLGLDPYFVSAIGNDADGDAILESMESWELDTSGIVRVSDYPTGRVDIKLDQGQPTFEILENQAYDRIAKPGLNSIDLLYFGSLANRSDYTLATLRSLWNLDPKVRFIDLNIRKPWFSDDRACDLLENADWVKLNDEELHRLTDVECNTETNIERAVNQLRDKLQIENCCVTRGELGAILLTPANDKFQARSRKIYSVIDTVGAGDAFSAALIAGLAHHLSMADLLQLAVDFAAHSCTIQGATTSSREHYLPFRERIRSR